MIKKSVLESLYMNGLSMSQIADQLKCSQHKVVYRMNKHNIPRRNQSEASYVKQNPDGDPFKIKTKLNKKDLFLYGLGLGIYWGEGTKVGRHSVRVSNTDPRLLLVFRNFLIKICQLNPNKISYSIVTFHDTSPTTARRYWSSKLNIPKDKFGKITQIQKQGKGTYHKKSKYGVCTLAVGNIKLKRWILNELAHIKPG